MPPGSQLWIVAAGAGATDWSPVRARYTLRGDIEVVGTTAPPPVAGNAPPEGRVMFSGILLAGQLRSSGQSLSIGLQDCTLVPGRRLARNGLPTSSGTPSLLIGVPGSDLTLDHVITGPVAIDAAASARVTEFDRRCHLALAGGLCRPGRRRRRRSLHIEDSTIIGKVRAHDCRSPPTRSSWRAAAARSMECRRVVHPPPVRLRAVLFRALRLLITPRPVPLPAGGPGARGGAGAAIRRLHYGRPSYGLLAGDCPVAVWQGADDESQIGAYHLLFETQGVANLRTRFDEYLPFGLEAGIFLIPARQEFASRAGAPYGYGGLTASMRTADDQALNWVAIGAALI